MPRRALAVLLLATAAAAAPPAAAAAPPTFQASASASPTPSRFPSTHAIAFFLVEYVIRTTIPGASTTAPEGRFDRSSL